MAVASCKAHSLPVNYTTTNGVQAKDMGLVVPALNQYAFFVTVGLSVQDEQRETIDLVTGFADVEHCAGTLHWNACTLEAAIGEYDVRIENNAVTLESTAPKIIAVANNTAVSHEFHRMKGGYPSTLASVVYLGNVKWTAWAAYYYINGTIRVPIAGSGA